MRFDKVLAKNPERTMRTKKNIAMLIKIKGIKYFNPAFSSPLLTKPITRLEIELVVIRNINEK